MTNSDCRKHGWYPTAVEPCPTCTSVAKVQELQLQIRDLKYEFEQQDMALKNALETAKACDEAASQHAKHLDAANRLISEMKAEAERKDKLWEDATVKNLEALTELIEALAPFHLHGLALRGTILPDNATINKVGSSYLVKGAFETAIEAVQKWQDLLDGKEQQTEKRLGSGCIEDQHRGTECKCCHMIYHCCSHHCCCFYRCKTCRHSEDRHEKGPCDFGDNCKCTEYVGERR